MIGYAIVAGIWSLGGSKRADEKTTVEYKQSQRQQDVDFSPLQKSTTNTDSISRDEEREFRNNFISNCASASDSDTMKSYGVDVSGYCACSYDYLKQQYGIEKFITYSIEAALGKRNSDFMDDAVQYCVSKHR